MSVKWTNDQQNAINSSGTNVLVSAAAGSGKTAVLVQRVIRMITDAENPTRLDRILMVTYTNAAAAEMRTRIYKAITDAMEKDPENTLLREQLALLGQTQITTIHAFCQNLLRDNFHKAGISPDFTAIDDAVRAETEKACADSVIENAYLEFPEETDALAIAYGGRFDDSRLKGLITSLYKFIQCQPNPEKWLDDICGQYECGFGGSIWRQYLTKAAKVEIGDILSLYDEAIYVSNSGGVYVYEEFLSNEKLLMTEILKKDEWDDLYDSLNSFKFERLSGKPKDCDRQSAELAKKLRDKIKKQFEKVKNTVPAYQSVLDDEIKAQAKAIKQICMLTRNFASAYTAQKRKNNAVDFDDMLHLTLEMLMSDEEMTAALKEKYDEILVDEYQDTNAVSIALFEKISNGKNLFAVGDVKQSIYGFLNARPESFMDMYYSYTADGSGKGKKISLSNNFRSADNIIYFINILFGRLMTKRTGGVEYTDDQQLVYSNKDADSNLPVEIHILEEPPSGGELGDKLGNEAYFTAKRILRLVECEKPLIYDSKLGKKRPVAYSDIVILARSVKSDTAVEFVRQLTLCGIPVSCEETGSYFMTVEISAVVSFLQIIDNPYQDIPLLAVMRSPMFSFTENELAQIKIEHQRLSFHKAVFCSEMPKARNFCAELAKYTELAKTESLEILTERIITDTGYYQFVGNLPNGRQRMANLKLLCRRANMFEQGGRKSIFEYINYINAMLESGSEYKTARISAASENTVKIMTIHKSKGLEFPCVFLVKCGGKFSFKMNLSDTPAVFDPDYGIGLDYIDTEKMIKYPSVPKLAIKKQKLEKELREEMRVMYVALTRAKNYLCIVGSASKAQQKLEQWTSAPKSEAYTVNGANMLEWICVAAGDICKICVHDAEEVLQEPEIMPKPAEQMKKIMPFTYEEADERMSYKYKYSHSAKIPSKISVSELIRKSAEPRLDKLEKKDGSMSAADKGTVMHFVMQNIDIAHTGEKETEKQIEDMKTSGMLTGDEAAAVNAKAVSDFFASETGMRMKNSPKVFREYSFCAELPARDIFEGSETDEPVLVQGAIDCFFEEDDGFVIVDYKTGRKNEIYEKQLSVYSMCLEKLMNKPIKETILVKL